MGNTKRRTFMAVDLASSEGTQSRIWYNLIANEGHPRIPFLQRARRRTHKQVLQSPPPPHLHPLSHSYFTPLRHLRVARLRGISQTQISIISQGAFSFFLLCLFFCFFPSMTYSMIYTFRLTELAPRLGIEFFYVRIYVRIRMHVHNHVRTA